MQKEPVLATSLIQQIYDVSFQTLGRSIFNIFEQDVYWNDIYQIFTNTTFTVITGIFLIFPLFITDNKLIATWVLFLWSNRTYILTWWNYLFTIFTAFDTKLTGFILTLSFSVIMPMYLIIFYQFYSLQ